jgi:hypothetical protein
MPGLVPGIHVLAAKEDVDGRDIWREDGASRLLPSHDGKESSTSSIT